MGVKLIGIDPGKTGVIAEIDVEEKLCRWMPLPFREDTVLDTYAIKTLFNLNESHYIYVEKVHGMKIWGVANNFTFGYYYGQVRCFLEPWPYELIGPKGWQKRINGCPRAGKAKEMSAASFRRMNPTHGPITKKDEGMVDAFFIAYFAGLTNNIVMPKDFTFLRVDDFVDPLNHELHVQAHIEYQKRLQADTNQA